MFRQAEGDSCNLRQLLTSSQNSSKIRIDLPTNKVLKVVKQKIFYLKTKFINRREDRMSLSSHRDNC